MNQSLVAVAKRTSVILDYHISSWRLFCSSPSPAPNNKLFVGGLSWSVDEKSLQNAFTTYGEVTEAHMVGQLDNRSLLDFWPEQWEVLRCTKPTLLLASITPAYDLTAAKQALIVYDKETGRSRGFGFVNFVKEDEAKSAKDAMDGKAFLGRPLRISFALDKVRGTSVVVPRLYNVREV